MKDGEDAFPCYTGNGTAERGMTLRDYFAGQALTGMLAHSRNGHGYKPANPEQHWHKAITQEAYDIADAMLEVREKKVLP